MPLTAEQSFALGSREGRDRINQQLRADPAYLAFLQSIGVDPARPLSDEQRRQATAWVQQHLGGIGSLEIDPAGNLNNRHGFAQEAKQWGPVAAAIAAPVAIPLIAGAAGAGAAAGGAGAAGTGGVAGGGTLAATSVPASLAMYGPAGIASQGASAAIPLAAGGAAALPASSIPAATMPGAYSGPAGVTSQNVTQGAGRLGLAAKGGSRVSNLLRDPDVYRTGAKAAQAFAQNQATNRATGMQAQYDEELLYQAALRDYHDAVVAREQEGRVGRRDAWQDLLNAQYIQNSQGWTSPTNSRYAIAAPSEGQRTAAKAMEAEVRKRLEQGNPIPEYAPPARFRFDPRYTRPGAGENAANWIGTGLDLWGTFSRFI